MNRTGTLIKQKRKEKKLTLEEVAEYLHVSKSTVCKYERGIISNLKRTKVIALCDLLDLNPMQLINGFEAELEQEITVDHFKIELNYLLFKTKGLNDSEKNLIKNYVSLICENKGD